MIHTENEPCNKIGTEFCFKYVSRSTEINVAPYLHKEKHVLYVIFIRNYSGSKKWHMIHKENEPLIYLELDHGDLVFELDFDEFLYIKRMTAYNGVQAYELLCYVI